MSLDNITKIHFKPDGFLTIDEVLLPARRKNAYIVYGNREEKKHLLSAIERDLFSNTYKYKIISLEELEEYGCSGIYILLNKAFKILIEKSKQVELYRYNLERLLY